MRLEVFRGRDLQSVSALAERTLREEVMILTTRVVRDDRDSWVEVAAVPARDVDAFRSRMQPGPLPIRGKGERPPVLALVGPAGSGKSTTLARLAQDPRAFGRNRVGVLTLDTVRRGGVEKLQALFDFPVEVVRRASDLPAALRRVEKCDVILIDTPARLSRESGAGAEWVSLLQQARPDEVHLVLPASLRLEIAVSHRHRYAVAGVTHLLLSRLDEVPGETGVTELATAVGLPARWVSDGEELQGGLHPATARLLASLGRGTLADSELEVGG